MLTRCPACLLLILSVLERGDNMQLLSRESESKEFEDVKILKEVKFKFPASNSLTGVDRKYFEMIRSEADWGNSTAGVEEQEPRRRGLPESFSLTETDREYFNIIKTEDGLSQFFKSVRTPAAAAAELPVELQDDSGVKEGQSTTSGQTLNITS